MKIMDDKELKDLITDNKVADTVPAGYIKIKLSTNGAFGGPKVVHARNFSTEMIVQLSMEHEKNLANATINLMQNLIYEDIDVKTLMAGEVMEILLSIYSSFWGTTLKGIPYPYTEEEVDYLEKEREELYEKFMDNKAPWTPSIDINIKDIKIKALPEGTKTHPRMALKPSGSVKFRLPSIGDTLIIKEHIDKRFGSRQFKLKKLLKQYEERRESMTEEEVNEVESFLGEQLLFSTQLSKALLLFELDGKELETVDEKLEASKDPRIDSLIMKKFDKAIEVFKYSIQPEMVVKSPMTGKKVERRFSFRIDDIIQAVQLYDVGEDDFTFE
jgi:hypothetical protein